MPLTDIAIKQAKPKDKTYLITDGDGLSLEISPSGGKWWRIRYRFQGKEKRLSLGVYPHISLKDARQRRDEFKRELAHGNDPSSKRKESREQKKIEERTFQFVALEYHERFKEKWTTGHAHDILRRLELHMFPYVGDMPIVEIKPVDILGPLRRIEHVSTETAHRVLSICSNVMRYAVACDWIPSDPCRDLKGALRPHNSKHMATIIEPKAIGALLRAIDGYKGTYVVQCALRLAPLVFVRPIELRTAEWEEINFDTEQWLIPAVKMKMRREHIVPLARQSLDILQAINPLTGSGRYVFPSIRTDERPLSEVTILAALRRLGYAKEEMTGHGFRAMASTRLNELGYNRDHIERQLAHIEGNKVRAAYNKAEFIQERVKMMQEWADYLDKLRNEK